MAPITTSTEVSRPPADVFAYVIDPGRFPEWQGGVVAGHVEGGGGVGDRCVTTRRIGMSERTVTAEITHMDPPRRWGVRGLDGPIRATVNVVVEPLERGRSRVTIDLEFSGYGIGKLLVPLVVAPGARREMAANVQRLKERLETQAAGAGSAPNVPEPQT
jgi:uncharacterized protein YndB with AHSA1/START domain